MTEATQPDGNTLEVHMQFDNPEQKEVFKAAFADFVSTQQDAARGRAGLAGSESIGTGEQPAGLTFYVNFIPRW
jgi:hypothetical protein